MEYIPLFEEFSVNKRRLIKRIYEELNSRRVTSKIYNDEYWKGVDDTIEAIQYACDEFHCKCNVHVENGGYEQNSDESGKRKVYKFEILDEKGIQITNGEIVCSAAGSLDYPFEKYDVCVLM